MSDPSIALELRGLSRRYGDTVALDELSLALHEGEVLGFVGPNGAGKTTAMRIVVGVLAPDAGEVRWHGRAVSAADRRRFGYMPEERGLYPRMRVGEQLVHLARLHGVEAGAAAVAAAAWMERLGVAERAGERVEALSLGNQQRVQLAAALVHDPELLVLDEPFSGLDPVATDVLAKALRERARAGVPVIFSSHQLELVERMCDAVAIVDRGRLVAVGEVEALRAEAAGPRRLRVVVEGTDTGAAWWNGLAGASARPDAGAGVVLELAEDADEQRVLDAARAAGRLTHFAPERPSLAELFRERLGR